MKLISRLFLYFPLLCVSSPSVILSMEPLPKASTKDKNKELFTEFVFSKTLLQNTSIIYVMALSPGEKILVTHSWKNALHLWNIEAGKWIKTLDLAAPIALSNHGLTLATGSSANDKDIRIIDLKKKTITHFLKEHEHSVSTIAFSDDDSLLLTGSYDRTACLWDVETGKLLFKLCGHKGTLRALAVSPCRKTILTGSDDTEAILWSIKKEGSLLHRLQRHTARVHWVAFVDEASAFTSSWDDTLRLWDVKKGALKLLIRVPNGIITITLNPNRTFVAVGSRDGKVCLWDAFSGSLLQEIQRHVHSVTALTFNARGTKLFTASLDGTVVLLAHENLLTDSTEERDETASSSTVSSETKSPRDNTCGLQ